MVPFDRVRDWLADHGYRDLYPRRDAFDADLLFDTFVREGRRRVGLATTRREVDPKDFEAVKREVLSYEQSDR